ncbi:uncharacterized protein LOC114761909 [Neltuma alba]|uniref:uncharacterized protein LOC114761752 n=1 Tax=Neltuma alba TaxID=207710 RepID=UPI0010A379B1|nr:uncharacterized protein LOC114761752 [Prosopis alba]XP_028807196.1 uncharacterized protein LOC114761909 [Prosopis alba]
MGDPWSIVPYNDPYDFPLPESILDFQNDHNLPPAGPSNEHNASPFPQQSDAILQDTYPNSGHQVIQDAAMRDFPHQEGNFEAGPSGLHGESHPSQENMHSQNFPEVSQLQYWPENPVPFLCSCCQVLREIIHTNGIKFSKLEIHGRLGVISHAILRQNISVGSSGDQQIHMLDFCRKSMEDVKNFLRQYCAEKNAAGYFTVQDPLSAYYEALCIGMEWNEDLNDEFLGTYADNSGAASDETEDMDRTARASLSTQRERAGKMKLSDFRDVFHLPIEEAARQVNLCPTVVKKICRKEGLARWPHRKIKSIERKINILRGTLNSAEAASRAQTEAEIERLKGEMIDHCGGVIPTSLNFNA